MQLMVIQDSDRLKIGSMAAQVGMELANGYRISKVNDKSVIGQCDGHTEKFFDPTSIYYTEAVCWGYTGATVDKKAENEAAIVRKFRHGEAAHRQYIEYGYAPPISNSIEAAGFDFAKEVQANRELAIAELLEAQEALSK